MVSYHEASKSECKRLAKLAADSFGDYPFFSFALRDSFQDEQDYRAYVEKLNRINLRAYMRQHKCFVGTSGDQIVSAALLQDPSKPKVNVGQYLMSGGASLMFPVGLNRILDFLSMTEEATADCAKAYPDAWYLEMLVVNGGMKGHHLGSRMLQDCILPYVHAKGGKTLSLITNTEQNCKFYAHHGFSEFSRRPLTRRGHTIMNWSFVRAV